MKRIKELLASFSNDEGTHSCSNSCRPSCQKQLLKASTWGKSLKVGKRRYGLAIFQVNSTIGLMRIKNGETKVLHVLNQMNRSTKVFNYHFLYTGANLVADIGGNLGLFLGLSVFSCVQVMIL